MGSGENGRKTGMDHGGRARRSDVRGRGGGDLSSYSRRILLNSPPRARAHRSMGTHFGRPRRHLPFFSSGVAVSQQPHRNHSLRHFPSYLFPPSSVCSFLETRCQMAFSPSPLPVFNRELGGGGDLMRRQNIRAEFKCFAGHRCDTSRTHGVR